MKYSFRSLFFFLSLIVSFALNGQGFLEQVQFGDTETFNSLPERSLLVKSGEVDEGTPQVREIVLGGDYLDIDVQSLSAMLNATGSREVIKIDRGHESIELWLIESPVIAPQFNVYTGSNQNTPIDVETKLYWGVVKNQPGSFVSLAVSENEVMGFFNVNGEDYTLGKLENSDQHILYKNDDLLIPNESGCAVDEALHDKSGLHGQTLGGSRDANNCVNMYVEANHNIYQDKGSVLATSNYVLGLFNQVGILYANELINFSVSELLVWDVPSPYSGPSSGDYLVQFRNEMGGNYNGDLAHLVGYGGGGGVAYLDVLCVPYWGIGYSGINSGYNNVPTYSWSVMVVTHEIGHNLGSPHTHNCSWNGDGNDAIDGCGPQAGYSEGCEGPVPSAGTIMSYCHLISGVGIDLSLGFGTQPGDLIRNNVYDAACLGGCMNVLDCQDPYNLSASNVTDTEFELSWESGGLATSWDIEYGLENFTPSGTPTVSGVGNPHLISGLNPNEIYDFYVRGICDGSEFSEWIGPLSVTTLATCPTPELLTADNITSSSFELSWNQLLTANSWDIEYGITGFAPTGNPTETGVTNPYTVSGLTSGASYTFYVRANCDGNEQSGWSDPITVTTLCDGNYGIPFTETFETSSISRSCWTQIIEQWGEQGGTGGEGELWTYQQGSSGGGINNAYEGSLNARYVSFSPSGAGSPVAKLISPELDLSGYDMIELSFFYGQEVWAGDQNELKVYYKSSPQDGWTELAHFTGNVDAWTQFVIPLENFSSTYRIAFEGINNWGRANVVDQVEVRPIPFSNLDETACDSFTLNGESFTESGVYTQTLVSAEGGDSLLFLNLTILESSFSSLTVSTCEEFNLNGTTYSETGQFTQVIPNAVDCDSTITLNLTITGEFDDCGECISGGDTNPSWNQSCADCNGDPNGTAFIDNCSNCVGGNTGATACVQDCNGDFGGTAFLDNCGDCVGGNTGESACVQDCNGDFGGTAFLDNCSNCVGGNTGETSCVQDCNGEWGGTAFLDNCGDCVGGNTGESACVQDCNGDFGGTAFLDNCSNCVGGNTGETACVQDCNGEWGGTAFLDNCNDCVGGSTGLTPCDQDCNGDFGGTAFLDNCGDCVGGNTGESSCVQDCNGDFGGSAFLDNCSNCVGGNTGETACVQDCNGEWGGTAFLDNCNDCVGGSTGLTPCDQDCNGDFGGTAFLDNCGDCVGGNTGESSCVQDCNGDFGGSAFLDNCSNCVGGNTGETACVQDCNGEWGGTAFLDNCNDCVGGSTGLTPCDQDCNGDFGGTAFLDNCGDCVGGNTGESACVQDCNGDFGGTAFLDNCSNCVGGNTGETACVQDCNGEWGGTAYLDECDLCVGGTTGEEPCCTLQTASSSSPADVGFANGTATVSVTGGTAPYSFQWNDSFFQTSETAVGLFPGIYTCEVSDFEGCVVLVEVEVTLASIISTTGLSDLFCNTSGHALSDFIACNNVQGAEAYRWEFVVQEGEALPEFTRYGGNKWIRLQWVSGISLGNTYDVRVKARVGGVWGDYSDVCEISTATTIAQTEVRPEYHPTNAQNNPYALCDFIIANSVTNATNYRWRFDPDTDPGNGNEVIYTRGIGNPAARLSWVNGLSPGVNYHVAVEAGVGSDWSGFGVVHEIAVDSPPQPALRTAFCDETYSPNQYVLSESVCEANYYQFQFEPVGGGTISIRTSGNYVCFLSGVSPSLSPGDYNVRVRVNQGGVLGEWGSACVITISGPEQGQSFSPTLREQEFTHTAVLFPNPNRGDEVRIQLEGLSNDQHDVEVSIFDVYGQRINTVAFGNSGSVIDRLIRFNNGMVQGMYMVRISVDGEPSVAVRLIVQ